MSGFLPLEDLEPTLSDVLAFIDTFSSDATTSATSSSSSSDGGSSPRPSAAPQSAVERRKTRKAAASRRCQHKKRAELLALRAQAAALESRLQELRSTGHGRQQLGVTQRWRHRARLEQQLRLQSQQRNRQLLTVLARQNRAAQAVRDVLNNVSTVVNLEEALRTPPPTNAPSVLEGFVPNLHDAIYAELATRLGRLHLDVETKCTSLDAIVVQNVSTGVQVTRDGVTGAPFVELKTAMTTNLGVKQTEQVVMSMKACHHNKFRKYLTELGMKKESEYELRDQKMTVALSTLMLSRSYEDENRLMLVFSSLLCDHPTDTDMRFREEGFILVTRSPTNPQARTVLQSCYRLTPEVNSDPFPPTSSSGTMTQDTEASRLFVLQNLGSMMWSNLQKIQASCIEAQRNAAVIPAAC
ncbi:hypothetical protein PHYPSEUDO_009836 [Phytophthora pseudosyringae]|uniref:BZIP domain-containing protein n=1 Tax=Phytophthora pseudosyringae TaxID=221518 RepID=A0A8T1W8L1_9STRA|nr:hypothetical protein PHYPSEUDO_009836 [Phytophthora pseudosyringae]